MQVDGTYCHAQAIARNPLFSPAIIGTGLPPDVEAVALLNWHLYPMARRAKAGCFEGAHDAATSDLDQLARWHRDYSGCNWRVVMGPSGLFGLDIDRPGTHKDDGFVAMSSLTAKHGPLPPRPMTRTGGSGGAALFFKHAGEPLRGKSGFPAPGLDPHRGRQAIVIPPSRHPVTGGAYTWRVAPWDLNPPPIPAWLSHLLAPPPEPAWMQQPFTPTDERARNAIMRAIHAVQDAAPGVANDTLNKQAYKLGMWCGAGFLAQHEAELTLLSAAQARSIPFREACDTIRSGIKAGARQPMQARHAG